MGSSPHPVPWLTIGRGKAPYSQAEAEQVLAGFAFGTTDLKWSATVPPSSDPLLAAPPRATTRPNWSYRIYDCLPNSPYAFSVTDLLAVAALDVGAGAIKYLAMEAVLPDLNEALAHIDVAQTFLALDRDDLGTVAPMAQTASWWMWRAWELLMGLKGVGVGVAITHKVLHRKRPWLFPIFDNQTVGEMGGRLAWQVLHCELTRQPTQFDHLEQWFAGEATRRGGMPLTRLRIHDILLWAAITDSGAERDGLVRAGDAVLRRAPSDLAPPDATEAGIDHFRDDDAGFLAWLEANPDGYFVNTERNPKPTYLVLHRPACPHFTSVPPRNLTKDYVKFCSPSRAALELWATDVIGGELSLCRTCFGQRS